MHSASQLGALKSGDKYVLLALSNYADDEGYAWPKQTTIASWVNRTRESVNASLGRLEKIGYIKSEQTYRDDGGKSFKRYKLIFLDRMDELPLTPDAIKRQEVRLERLRRQRERGE